MSRLLIALPLLLLISCSGSPATPNPRVVIDTSMGIINVELFPDKAPKTVSNFLRHVDEKFYDGMIVHAVNENATICAGLFDSGMREKAPLTPLEKESCEESNNLSNNAGTITMARNGTQALFSINVSANPDLDRDDLAGDQVFGRVTEGLDVVARISNVPIRSQFERVPVDEIRIRSIRRASKAGDVRREN